MVLFSDSDTISCSKLSAHDSQFCVDEEKNVICARVKFQMETADKTMDMEELLFG